jgi:hypothetical protein
MANKIIRICYRKIIDVSSQKPWDKLVFESTYKEFLMQSQFYNQEKKFETFSEMLIHVPAAENLHFLVSASVIGYLQQLGGKIPDIQNKLGRHFLDFKNYRFEIINSGIKNKDNHQVAINFFSEPFTWHDTIGNYLLLSPLHSESNENGVLTDLVQLQPFCSIYSLKTEME